LQAGEFGQRWPQILPGGKAALVTSFKLAASMEGATVDVVTLADRKSKTLVHDAIFGRYLPTGHLVWFSGGTLFAAPFDPDRLELRGNATPVVERVSASNLYGFAEFDFSRTGTLIYRSGAVGSGLTTIQWLDASGKTTPLMAKPCAYTRPRLSPDGKRLAVTMEEAAGMNIWIFDIERDNLSRLTHNDVAPSAAVWSPDGQYIAYQAGGQGGSGMAWMRADGSGQPQKLSTKNAMQKPSSFTPDGRRLVFLEPPSEGGSFDIWTLPLRREGSGVRPGAAEPFLQGGESGLSREPTVSPDGRWLAWGQRGPPEAEVYVRMFGTSSSAAGSRWQISNNGGDSPVWSPTANELFYHSAGNIMVVPYTVKGDLFVAERPRIWARLPAGVALGGFDLAPDGKRFVVAAPVEEAQAQIEQSHVTFLLNFFDELRRRAPAK
jgi:serine/threonine-protein kinase